MKKMALFLACLGMFTSSALAASTDYDLGYEENDTTDGKRVRSVNDKPSDSAVKGIAKGVKQVVYEGPKDLVTETAEEAPKKPPVLNVIEGVNRGTQKLVDHTIKGAYRVATLGTSELESYEVQEPEKGSGEPTKFKISIPGT